MKHAKLFLFLTANIFLTSCQPGGSHTNSEQMESETDAPATEKILIDAYVKDVSNTSPILVSGLFEGKKVDYIVSSQPVIQAAMSKNDRLSIYENIGKSFGRIYQTEGFPQAGLFVKSSLLSDASKKESVLSFLKTFDFDLDDLVTGGKEAVNYLNAYSDKAEEQAERFGYQAKILSALQKENGLAFLSSENQPKFEQLQQFSTSLNIDFKKEDFSSLYGEKIPDNVSFTDKLPFSIITPKGAPSAVFSRYGKEKELVDFASPSQVSAEFTKQEKDFIVFDSVNGTKLSAKNDHSYQLVRMVTFGNLYLVSTGNDEDGKIDNEDMIVSYGENLVSDLAFKAVYSK